MKSRGPVVLVVLDGFGVGQGGPGDATALADAPFFAKLRAGPCSKPWSTGRITSLPVPPRRP